MLRYRLFKFNCPDFSVFLYIERGEITLIKFLKNGHFLRNLKMPLGSPLIKNHPPA